MIRILFLLLGAVCVMAIVAAGIANADADRVGTTSANFLSVGSGPRILGMGGATLGLGGDLASGAWNPAGLGWMEQTAVTLSHASLDNQSLQEWAAVGGRYGTSDTRWAITGLYQGDGSLEGRDGSNNPTGSFSASSFAVGAHVAQQWRSMFTVGLGFKTVSEKLADVSGLGITFDGGVMFRKGMVGAGVAFQNLGGRMKYPGGTYRFPTNYGMGVAVSHPGTGLSFALDANFPSAYYNDVRAGAEYRWKDMVALRAGYRHHTGVSNDALTGPTFGLGAGRNGFWFDYGYLVSGNSSGQHRVALTFFPGMWSGFGTDPFGQGDMPREFGNSGGETFVGPQPPKGTKN